MCSGYFLGSIKTVYDFRVIWSEKWVFDPLFQKSWFRRGNRKCIFDTYSKKIHPKSFFLRKDKKFRRFWTLWLLTGTFVGAKRLSNSWESTCLIYELFFNEAERHLKRKRVLKTSLEREVTLPPLLHMIFFSTSARWALCCVCMMIKVRNERPGILRYGGNKAKQLKREVSAPLHRYGMRLTLHRYGMRLILHTYGMRLIPYKPWECKI